jgi:hypothetical protein
MQIKNLFIVGAQRSGSTYVYSILDDHPQVSMIHPVRPEPKFFMNSQLVEYGRNYYIDHYFSDRKQESIYLGEKSTSYLESKEVAAQIKKFYPDARIIIILRNPVLRAYSHYLFSVANDYENLSFKEALEFELEREKKVLFNTSVSPYAYKRRGQYMDYIDGYLEIFDSSQITVLIFEEFVNNLYGVQALYRWLGINENFVPPSLNKVFNPSTVDKKENREEFNDLVFSYCDSIMKLEGFLGRRINIWHEHHMTIVSGK